MATRVLRRTHVASRRSDVAELRLFSRVIEADQNASLDRIARDHPLRHAKLLILKDRDLAERVGFVPEGLAPLNDLRRIGTARIRQNL